MPIRKNYNKKRSQTVKKNSKGKTSQKKAGLNLQEKSQVKKMIKGNRETFYINTIQYALGQGVESTLKKSHLSPKGCFQSGNRITMIGLVTGETFNSMGNDVNGNATYSSGQRLFLTAGIRAKHLNGVTNATLDGDMGYMKSHLQRLKIHCKALGTSGTNTDKIVPMNFRVICVQVNGAKPAGNLPSMTNVGTTASPSLFRNADNITVGIDDQITTPFEFTNNLRLDTQAFKVVRDIRFKLNNTYPLKSQNPWGATKEIDIWLPQPKKPVKFDEGTELPTNYDYRYYTLVFCSSDSTYDNNQLGTTEDRWCLETTSISRVQEY